MLTSPEMCLKHEEYRKLLSDGQWVKNICALVIDEAHCISQWGGNFRPSYDTLDKLHSFLPPDIPVLAVTATATKSDVRELRGKLSIDAETCFFLNLGNDRPNIAMSVQRINNAEDYDALKPLLTKDVKTPADLKKTLVFMNTRMGCQIACRYARSLFGPEFHSSIDFLHAHRTKRAKRRVMKEFRQGKIKVLFGTEAVGMVGMIYSRAVSRSHPFLGRRHSRHRTRYSIWSTVVYGRVVAACWKGWSELRYQSTCSAACGEGDVCATQETKEKGRQRG